MYRLVEYGNDYENLLKEVKKQNLIPVTLFKIILADKNKSKENLKELQQTLEKIKPDFSALQIQIDKQDNSTVSIISQLKNLVDITIGLGGLNKINRFFLEQTRVDYLQDPQNSLFNNKIDFIHHLNSGINHVLGNLAKDRNIGFLFTLNFTSNKRQTPKEIGRINQNLIFARKYTINTSIGYILTKESQIKTDVEISNIIKLFDISTKQQKEILNSLQTTVENNKFKKSPNYITQGITVE